MYVEDDRVIPNQNREISINCITTSLQEIYFVGA